MSKGRISTPKWGLDPTGTRKKLGGDVTKGVRRRVVISVLSAVSVACARERRIAVDAYRDRMKGGWIGQIIGVTWGAPTEFKFTDTIIPEDKVPAWTPEMVNQAFGQDDLYVEMTFLRSLEQYGLDVDIRQAGIDFANSEYRLWCANDAGRKNLRRGIAPPDSSHPRFSACPNDIDYQIEADFAGLISPGMPNAVITLGEKFGRLMNYGDGVYGGQFMGGLYAEAFFEEDVHKVIAAGLACIPPDSQYAEMVRDVVSWHRESPDDWMRTWQRCLKKYRKDPAYQKASNGAIDVKINGAMVLLGLLYGEGDMGKTVVIAMRGGYDSDCNPSSAAGVLSTMTGFSKLPVRYTQALELEPKFSYTAYNVPALLDVCERLARQVVARQGGRIERDADGREWFVIAACPAHPGPVMWSWAPGRVAGSCFTDEEYAKIRFKPHPGDVGGNDPTARVQGALDALLPGWKTSANGKDMEPGYRDEYLGRQHVVMTHPLDKDTGVTLSKCVDVPQDGAPKLEVILANHGQGDFSFVARVDGREILHKKIEGRPAWQTVSVDLAAFAGKTVAVELVNQPDGWSWEAAYWGGIEIKKAGR